MKRDNLTNRAIESLKPGAVLRDSQAAGLSVRVTAKKRKVFFWSRRRDKKAVDYKTLGNVGEITLEQARTKAAELNSEIGKWKLAGRTGPSPLDAPPVVTLEFAFENYAALKNPKPQLKQGRSWLRRFCADLLNRDLSTITRQEMIQLHAEVRNGSGPVAANRVVAMLHTVIRWNTTHGHYTGPDPTTAVEYSKEEARERFLSPEELARLLAVMETERDRRVVDFVKLSLFTGARKNDILSMAWADISQDANGLNRWTVPNSKGKPYNVALAPEAWEVLARRRKETSGPWVFPGRASSGRATMIDYAWWALRKRAGLLDVHIHDLRRTHGSWLAAAGVPMLTIAKALGHRSLASTGVYARLDLTTVRAAVSGIATAMTATTKNNLLPAGRS